MKGQRQGLILLFLLFTFTFGFSHNLFAEDYRKEIKKAGTGTSEGTVIRSDTLEINDKQKIITFKGNVEARKEGFVINCEEMFVYYNSGKIGKEEPENIKIDKIIATGKVRIIRTDGGVAHAERAVYDQDTEKLILTGNPVVRRGNDFVEGSTITLFLKEDRSIVEGSDNQKVRAVLSAPSEKK
ncbi:MAG: lipopolysaccharide transport periplasmic protein LptA [Pseudomonadota bacterium]